MGNNLILKASVISLSFSLFFTLTNVNYVHSQVVFGAEEEVIPKIGDTIREYYSNSKSIQRIKFRDAKFLTITEFSETRQKKTSTKFPLDNLKDKTVVKYHENGKTAMIATYIRGFTSGPIRKFHENGKLSEVGAYHNIAKDGEWLYYDS